MLRLGYSSLTTSAATVSMDSAFICPRRRGGEDYTSTVLARVASVRIASRTPGVTAHRTLRRDGSRLRWEGGGHLVEGPRHRHQVDNLLALDLHDEASLVWLGTKLWLDIDGDFRIRLGFEDKLLLMTASINDSRFRRKLNQKQELKLHRFICYYFYFPRVPRVVWQMLGKLWKK